MDVVRVVLTARQTDNEVQLSRLKQKKEKLAIWSEKGEKVNSHASYTWSRLGYARAKNELSVLHNRQLSKEENRQSVV
ncbi:hypothetical protein C5167_002883 [Papaver somniferum]|uniref:Uncharacterized protein n=1 Tax=Papaver somniferum TaxID=3469 RepID=A0A4Y7KZG3_PAPSO|nr:hypothetical protein C5167_002883 [Papaver somniferum]